MSSPIISKPSFEHHYNGIGVGKARPRVSWHFDTYEETLCDWYQTAYELEITILPTNTTNTYKVQSDQSVLVAWPGDDLDSRSRAKVRVRCYGQRDDKMDKVLATAWSPEAIVETGHLHPEDWTASFITSSSRIGPEEPLQPLRFRREFNLPMGTIRIVQARLYLTSLGVNVPFINGKHASDECMAPGWTSYEHRLNYRVLEVSELLSLDEDAPNVIAVEVGEGWYATRLGVRGGSRFWYGGKHIALLAQLEVIVETQDGSQRWTLNSDDSWLCAASSIQKSEIYDGELYDMRQDQPGWNDMSMKLPEISFVPTRLLPKPSALLIAPDGPPVKIIETVSAKQVITTPSGKLVVDFGQNLVGKVLIKSLKMPAAGEKVVLSHAEVLEEGELGTRPLRSAKCTDVIISDGSELKNWSVKFTFHGFRYVQIDGVQPEHEFLLKNITALVMSSDLKRRGHFSCSNTSVNQLHQNVVWSMKGNFLSVPTDCPQRDERLGWTGDLQVFCPTASFLYDTVGFLGNWLEDLSVEQLQRGGIPPLVCPDVLKKDWPNVPQAVWDDVTILTPNVVYQYSADKDLLSRQFESMQTWLSLGVDRGSDGLWDWSFEKWQFGDWLDPTAPPQEPGNGRTDDILVADAYLVRVTTVFAELCKVLGKTEEAEKYNTEAANLKKTFQEKYITSTGNLMSNTQTGLSLAIEFSLYRSLDERKVAILNLEKLVRRAKFRIATGFAGTPLILHALTAVGKPQLAYRMLLEKRCPSWMYPITMGATTIWERWDSMLPNGSINPGQMTSFNHYALGAVADWLHTTIGGISPVRPGWKEILVRPIPGGNITHAHVSFEGPYGLIRCSWRLENGTKFTMDLVVPPNSSARVILPSWWRTSLSEMKPEQSTTVGSGKHHFSCDIDLDEWPPKSIWTANSYGEESDVAV